MNKIIDFVIDSINAGRERLKMSIVTFYISLLALYHWRVFAILFFGGIPMMDRIAKVDELYKEYTPWFYLLNPILILLVSVIFMILFPTIMWLSEKVLVYVSIKRKEKKEEEDATDRTKDIEIVRHQFKLKQEETGNLKESEYVDEIKKLRELVSSNLQDKMELEKELSNEREKQKIAINNLKNGFETVEKNYKEQIEELNRQLTILNDEGPSHILIPSRNVNESDYSIIRDIDFKYHKLNVIEKKYILEIINNLHYEGNVISLKHNERTGYFMSILSLMSKIELITMTEDASNRTINISTNKKGLHKIIL